MQGRALYRRSTFFVDVINVVLYADLFMYHDLSLRMKTDSCLQYFFEKNIPKAIKGETIPQMDIRLTKELSAKKHQNILEDWIDKEEFIKLNGEEVYDEYVLSLHNLILSEPVYDEYIQTTSFGEALKLLTKDDRIDKIIFYVPFDYPVVTDNLIESFSRHDSGKMEIMIGGKDIGTNLPLADSYVFENVSDIDNFLRIKHDQLTEVIVPAYEYNLAKDRSTEEREIEQVTIKRLNLKESGNDYAINYNLSINSLNIPF